MKQKKHAVGKNARQPANGESGFPIVGIGASAGGLKAFEEFFSAMPANSGMAFVLVQHLAPAHKSILCQLSRAEILEPYRTQRLTKDGRVIEVSIISTSLLKEVGEMYAIATTERVIAGGTP